MERLPIGRQFAGSSRGKRTRARFHRAWARTGLVTGTVLLAGLALPASLSVGAQATTASPEPPSMKALLAKANKMARQVEVLSNQYDALKIQLQEATTEAALASKAAERDAKQLTAGQLAVGQIAAQGYMTGGFDPTLQLLQSSDPQGFVNRVSIMLQLQHENGDRVTAATTAEERRRARRADRAAGEGQGRPAVRGDEEEGRRDPGQRERAEQRRLQEGHGDLPADRLVPQRADSRRQLDRRPGAALGADPPRRRLRLGRGRPDHLRLLGPGHVGLRARRDQPGAPDLRPVERGRARPQRPGRSPAT